jgi:TolB-like protein
VGQVSVTSSNGDCNHMGILATARSQKTGERPMPESAMEPRPMLHDLPASDRLDSWKEIAAYLKKDVRTVQRWEKNMGLPVRRLTQGKQGTVFAYRSSLDSWWLGSPSKLTKEEGEKTDIDAQAPRANGLVLEVGTLPSETIGREHAEPRHLPRIAPSLALLSVTVMVTLAAFSHQIRHAIWPAAPKVILVIRPLKNISADPAQVLFADGQSEEMISRLGQLHLDEMGIVPPSLVYASTDFNRIDKEFRADYVLEGAIHVSRQPVPITAQLLRVSDHTLVWAEPCDRDLQDVPVIRRLSERSWLEPVCLVVIQKPGGQTSSHLTDLLRELLAFI